MATAYQNIAKAALMNWNGLSEEEANLKIQNESVGELDNQVYALGSVKHAVVGIARQLGLNAEETLAFFDATVNGPEDAEILKTVTEKIAGFTEKQKLDVLAEIHDGWVVDNSSEKTFQKKVDREQLRQYAPIELIGWNEVKSDLLFLEPILSSVGVEISEEKLSAAYHERVNKYLEEKQIDSKEKLTELVSKGKTYYDALPEELDARLLPMGEIITTQIITNWENKDQETFAIFKSRMEKGIENKL